MKGTKVILPIVLIAALCLSWFVFATSTISENAAYQELLAKAESSTEQGLYEQAIEFYKKALTYKNTETIYEKIKEAYDTLYAEDHVPFIRSCYIEDMAVAAKAFPKHAEFWTKQIELQIEAQNYSKAFKVAKQALNYGAKSNTLTQLHKTLLYMVKVDYDFFTNFKTALNGYISVFDGANWCVIDDNGAKLTGNYVFAGLINDEGKGLYTNNVDTRLLDSDEIPRARFKIMLEEAGYYNENSDLVPVKIDGVWKYMNSAGEFLPGEYEMAGSFYDKQAVASIGGKWFLIAEDGTASELSGLEDIKLDLYGCHIQNDIVIGKSEGKYHIYDKDFNMVGDFEADDMDICIDAERIAFQKNGKWGFVNCSGEIVLEPQYSKAKSFANGYAAVCNEDGLWGFLKDDFDLVIAYQFLDAYYFTQAETCLVSTAEGTFQRMFFMFE